MMKTIIVSFFMSILGSDQEFYAEESKIREVLFSHKEYTVPTWHFTA